MSELQKEWRDRKNLSSLVQSPNEPNSPRCADLKPGSRILQISYMGARAQTLEIPPNPTPHPSLIASTSTQSMDTPKLGSVLRGKAMQRFSYTFCLHFVLSGVLKYQYFSYHLCFVINVRFDKTQLLICFF